MAITYDTLGSTVTINPVGAIAPSQLNTAVAIVGGYDSSNADSGTNTGEATIVNSAEEADTAFGADSELAYQVALALNAGATEVHGIPVPETTGTTETFGSSSATASGTVSNTPVFDDRLHPDHSVTAQDVTEGVSMSVNMVDADSPAQPSSSNTMNFNPETGNWAADTTSEYSITYDYGDYATAMSAAASRSVRNTAVCTEADSVVSTAKTDLENAGSNFHFGRAIVGSDTDISPSNTGSYTPAVEDWRIVEVAPARATDNSGNTVRTVGAIAGLLAKQPIDVTGSITYDDVPGLDTLSTNFTPTQAENFTQVTAITDNFEIAQGVTTSSEATFRDIYAVEIIDTVVEQIFAHVKSYRGGSNTLNARRRFKSKLKRTLGSMSPPTAQPPLLATGTGGQPYTVTVTQGSTDTEADVNIGIEVAPIAKEVVLDFDVGPIQFLGASTA